jgi:hypothetical protein
LAKKLLTLALLASLTLIAGMRPAPEQAPDRLLQAQEAREPAVAGSDLAALQGWTYVVVATGADIDPDSKVAIDPSGQVHVTYCNQSTERLMHGYLDGASWHPPAALPITDLRCDRWTTALDSGGYLHVAYESGIGSSEFRHVWQTASGWFTEQVGGETTVENISLAIDDNGYPHLVYNDDHLGGSLRYIYKTGAGWQSPQTIDSNTSWDWPNSMVLDGSNRPHVAYTRDGSTELRYTQRKVTGWYGYTADPYIGTIVVQPSLGLNSGGYPHICYYGYVDDGFGGETAAFEYVYRDTSGWQGPYILDNITHDLYQCGLAVDGSDFVHMSYLDGNSGILRYRQQDAQGWHQYDVAQFGPSEEPVGEYNSLAVDYGGRPAISYYDTADGGKLMLAVGEARQPTLLGNTSCAWGSRDCNRCAEDLVSTFNSLRQQGDIMGFQLGTHPDPQFDPPGTIHGHWQGVQRLTAKFGQYMVVTRDEVDNGQDDGSAFAVVELGTRNWLGERFRSNRLWPRQDVNSTPPDAQDIIVHTEFVPTDYVHPGSIQTLGDLMPVGTDREVHLYNMAEPESPFYVGQILDRPGKTSSSTAMAQLADGRYLLAVAEGSAATIDFYVSYTPGSYTSFWHVDEWSGDEVIWDSQFNYGWNSYQNVNLITDCSGKLYLLGTGNLGSGWLWFEDPYGPDWASLYEVGYQGTEITLTKVAERHFYCTYRGTGVCSFDAAGGAYVDPQGNLLLYATEHDNDGPNGSIKFMEFRPQPHGTCQTIEDAWVEVFQDKDFGGRSLMIDYVDTQEYAGHDLRRYETYLDYTKMEDFDGRASSLTWCLPPGWAYRLYRDPPSSSSSTDGQRTFLSLYGAGRLMGISDLKTWGLDNQISSSFYSQDPPIVVQVFPGTGKKLIYAAYLHQPGSASAAMSSPTADTPPDDADGLTIVDVPAGAVGESVTLTYTPTLPAHAPPAPLRLAGRAFTVTVTAGGAPDADYAFLQPVPVTIQYHPDEIASVDEGTLALYRWDAGSSQWVDAATTCHPTSNYTRTPEEDTLVVSICRSGEYALMGSEVLPAVLFDEAHDEQKTLDWDRALELSATLDWHPDPTWLYFGEAEDRLSDEFSLERNASAPLSEELLSNYQALIVATNQEALSDDEVTAIKRYVAGGGGLVLLGECGYGNPNPELASAYGIDIEAPCLFAPTPQLEGTVIITHVLDHAAVGDALDYAHNWGQSLSISGSAVSLADTTGTDAWADVNGNDQYDAGEEGIFDIGAAYDAGCGRVVVLADGTFADADLEWNDNDILLRALLRWVTDGPPCGAPTVYLPVVLYEQQ